MAAAATDPRAMCRWCVLFALTALLPGCGRNTTPVDVTMVAFNDFHGSIRSPGTLNVPDPSDPARQVAVSAGGAEYLASQVHAILARSPNHVVVSAGDLIGASPLVSGVFHDEPTIDGMNSLGLEFSAVGNHEFDDGREELLRMQHGGCHPQDPCRSSATFAGASFKYLAANVVDTASGKTLFPAYQIKSFDGIPVAFVGIALKGTPAIVAPGGITGLEFKDEAEAVNALIPELKSQGIQAIVVLQHDGLDGAGAINGCPTSQGEFRDVVSRLDPAVDIVVSGHTHQAYNCTIDGKLVTSAMSFGRVLTEIHFSLDRTTHDIVRARANNIVVTQNVPKDAAQTAILERVAPLVSALENRVVGSATAKLDADRNAAGESSLGDIIADAQFEATRFESTGGAQLAFMNPGGIRTLIVPGDAGRVTYGQLFATQPFGNSLVTLSLTGQQIHDALEQQWSGANAKFPRVLQVSRGLAYTWDESKPPGERVLPGSLTLNGVPIRPDQVYRVTVNSFLAGGGDNFTVFTAGTRPLGGPPDVDALEAYFKTHSPVGPGTRNRITRKN